MTGLIVAVIVLSCVVALGLYLTRKQIEADVKKLLNDAKADAKAEVAKVESKL